MASPQRRLCSPGEEAARHARWNQLRANVLQRPVLAMRDVEASLRGAALIGWAGVGALDLKRLPRGVVRRRPAGTVPEVGRTGRSADGALHPAACNQKLSLSPNRNALSPPSRDPLRVRALVIVMKLAGVETFAAGLLKLGVFVTL